MKGVACTRAWQAEAVQDVRLSKADVASFQRHAEVCAVCRREVDAFHELRQALEELPTRPATPLEGRRLRNKVLRRAHELTVRASGTRRTAWLAAAATIALVAACLVLWLPLPAVVEAPTETVDVEVPTFRITASVDAEWRKLEEGRTLRLSIRRGHFELSVDPLKGEQRFLIELPDGELEVKGTRFVVDLEGGKTRSVRVMVGRVVLSLHGHALVSLQGGESWPVEPRPSASAARSASGKPTRDSEVPATARNHPSRSGQRGAVGGSSSAGAPRADSNEQEDLSMSSSAFLDAMSAFSGGDYGKAEQLFTDYERSHPADSRLEDVLFVRAVARSRRGDESGARAIAREYLRRYPDGFRRAEMERLLVESTSNVKAQPPTQAPP